MNPLLFADWGRMNRIFTRIMWAVAAVMICVICVVLAAPSVSSHAAPAPSVPSHAAPALVARPAAAVGSAR
jgi:hypothetical protein